jgi:hypothetical protein
MRNDALVHTFQEYVDAGNVDEVKRMLSEGFSLADTETFGSDSALMLAADAGNREMVKLLVDAGADVNYANETGDTPLSNACVDGSIEVVRYLLEKGANIANVDLFGATIFDRARDHPELLRFLNEYVEANKIAGLPQPFITYFGTGTRVEPGDSVKMRRWFRSLDGVVLYVPRLSPTKHAFGLLHVGIQTEDQRIYAVKVSGTRELKRFISFRARGSGVPPKLPAAFDDPISRPPVRYR